MKGCSHTESDKDDYQQWTTAINVHCNSGRNILHVGERLIEKLPHGLTLLPTAILRCALFVFGSDGC